MINKFFIPVLIPCEKLDGVLEILTKQIHWIVDELNNKPKEHKLFRIKNGVLKTIINTG